VTCNHETPLKVLNLKCFIGHIYVGRLSLSVRETFYFFLVPSKRSKLCSLPRALDDHVMRRYFTFLLVSWGGVRLSPLGTSAANWPIVPAPDGR
jgi:hypothetical protein